MKMLFLKVILCGLLVCVCVCVCVCYNGISPAVAILLLGTLPISLTIIDGLIQLSSLCDIY